MHILFVHKNFPAQFGHIASYLARHEGFRCTFVCELPAGEFGGVERLQYQAAGGATQATHYCSRTFENSVWHAHAVYERMKQRPDIQPDLIVGHSGLGSTYFLRELYDCPIINYFEYYYHTRGSDMDFRPESPSRELDLLRTHTRNAMILTDLHTCDAGYSPTAWQRSLLPREYQDKIETIFDGIDVEFWCRRPTARRIRDRRLSAETRVVTYVSRGFEPMRGFDIFMRVAKRICEARPDVLFVCVGSDRICYGGDLEHLKGQTYREHILAQDDYDPNRFLFTGMASPAELADILNLSDLHIYLTAPFVLSWSMMNALACGCTVLGSDTPPVREMIEDGKNGLLADFFDVDRFTELALRVLDDPQAYRPLGQAGEEMIRRDYSLGKTLPRMLDLYNRTISRCGPRT